jgi:hypothetical protein
MSFSDPVTRDPEGALSLYAWKSICICIKCRSLEGRTLRLFDVRLGLATALRIRTYRDVIGRDASHRCVPRKASACHSKAVHVSTKQGEHISMPTPAVVAPCDHDRAAGLTHAVSLSCDVPVILRFNGAEKYTADRRISVVWCWPYREQIGHDEPSAAIASSNQSALCDRWIRMTLVSGRRDKSNHHEQLLVVPSEFPHVPVPAAR